MYISTSTDGGIDWHDSRTIHEQVKSNSPYDIREEMVPEAIADDIAKDFPYVENIRERVLQALSEKSSFRFVIKPESKDNAGNTVYEDCGTYEADGKTSLLRLRELI